MEIILKPIAYVKNLRKEIADDNWGEIISEITLAEHLTEEAIHGIDEFSHLEIIFYFDKIDDSKIQTGLRHPRNNKAWPEVGILAQRGKNRPNKLGLTTVKLKEKKGRVLIVIGLDAIDGTPILDIKPVLNDYMPKGEIKQPKWSTELMQNYW